VAGQPGESLDCPLEGDELETAKLGLVAAGLGVTLVPSLAAQAVRRKRAAGVR
jgi:DNA-binding transcriptional LysR family regulator